MDHGRAGHSAFSRRDETSFDRPRRSPAEDVALKIRVLGSGAGGGFPQWNCNCRNCRGAREGTLKAKSRTQSSIAVSADSQNWALVNASPDILAQIKAVSQLQPGRKLRDTGITGVVLVDSQL